jgi:hypothetical protein
MKKALLILVVGMSIIALNRCGKTQKSTQAIQQAPQEESLLESMEKNGLKLTEVFSTDYSGSVISPNKILATDTSLFYDFMLMNFNLGIQTPDALEKKCANSAKGQHIHHILNNNPYTAEYLSIYEKKLPPGHYVSLSFLSRSYHESVKTLGAYYCSEYDIGPANPANDSIDLRAAQIFYSRPKGEYIGEVETSMVLLDFFISNCILSEKGYYVIATINGTKFKITNWKGYWIEGLPMGESTIELALYHHDGTIAKSPYNPVKRKIVLKAA